MSSHRKQGPMDYLLEKIDDRIEELLINRQVLININNYENYLSNRTKLIQNSFYLEDGLREVSQAMRTSMTQNADLIEQYKILDIKFKNLDGKHSVLEKSYSETKLSYKEMQSQFEILRKRAQEDEQYIYELEKRLTETEEKSIRLKNENLTFNPSLDASPIKYNMSYQLENNNTNNLNFNQSHIEKSKQSTPNPSSLNQEFLNSNSKRVEQLNKPINYKDNLNNVHLVTLNSSNPMSEIFSERESNRKYFNDIVNDKLETINRESPIKTIHNIPTHHDHKVQPHQLSNQRNFNFSLNTNHLDNNNFSSNKRNRASRIADIVLKINSSPETQAIIIQIFGDNILEPLMSNTNESLIERLEQTIEEIEKLKEKDNELENQIKSERQHSSKRNINPYQNEKAHTIIEEKDETTYDKNEYENDKKYYDERERNISPNPELNKNYDIESINSKHMNNKSFENYKNRNKYHISNKIVKTAMNNNDGYNNNFEESLRKYNRDSLNTSNGLSTISNPGKVFKNYTTPYLNYFDPPLQKGGYSKLENKLYRSKSKPKSKKSYNFSQLDSNDS